MKRMHKQTLLRIVNLLAEIEGANSCKSDLAAYCTCLGYSIFRILQVLHGCELDGDCKECNDECRKLIDENKCEECYPITK